MPALVNLTPHEVVVLADDDDVLLRLPPKGLARVSQTFASVGQLDVPEGTTPLVNIRDGDVVGLPEPHPDVYYVVSWLTYHASAQREDLLVTADEVRDEAGRILGCRALGRLAPVTS
ncbi:MAG: hypothetical protein ACR2G2_07000 [Pseudonocardia sp.]